MSLNRFLLYIFIALLSYSSCSKAIVSEETPRMVSRLLASEKISGLKQISNPEQLQFEFFFEQAVDHFDAKSSTFRQKVKYTHRGRNRPTVIITEGYKMANNYIAEMAELLDANEIIVEHRYTGESLTEEMDLNFLNLKQACADYHELRLFYKKLYPENWIATGFSKGGQTAMMYKRLHPDDLVGSFSYNSPLNFSTNEIRIDDFFESVGSEECRSRLINFQRAILENKNDILPLLIDRLNNKRDAQYNLSGEQILEYMVLEYPFSFWQYHRLNCSEIPSEESSLPLMLNHLQKISSPEFFTSPNGYEYAMWQFYTEMGYYEHVTRNVEDLLSSDNYSNNRWLPDDSEAKFDKNLMIELNEWIQNKGDNMIFLYGSNDPWSASKVMANEKLNSKTYILEKGNHSTRIQDYDSELQQEMKSLIESWFTEF